MRGFVTYFLDYLLGNLTALLQLQRLFDEMTDVSSYELCDRWGTRYRSWLRYYATSRTVVGSIPDDVIGIFN